MKSQPDKLFRDKLANYNHPTPQGAWEKIASRQTSHKQRFVWIRVAASIAIVFIVAYVVWLKTENRSDTTPIANEAPTTTPKVSKDGQTPAPEYENAPSPKADPVINKSRDGLATRSTTRQEKVTTSTSQQVIANVATSELPANQERLTDQPSEVVLADEASIDKSLNDKVETGTITPTPKSLTLVFSESDVNDYRDKKYTAEATSEEKKPSTLKKLLRKANELTNNQDPLGELRQKKNEILALNFKSEKQRGQNK